VRRFCVLLPVQVRCRRPVCYYLYFSFVVTTRYGEVIKDVFSMIEWLLDLKDILHYDEGRSTEVLVGMSEGTVATLS
jgi:hypothetical protein